MSKALINSDNNIIQPKINTYVGNTYVKTPHTINRYDKVRSKTEKIPKRRFVKGKNMDVYVVEDDLIIEDLENLEKI